jgi:hypothetical protein
LFGRSPSYKKQEAASAAAAHEGAQMKRLATAATDFVEGAERNVAIAGSLRSQLQPSPFSTSAMLVRARASTGGENRSGAGLAIKRMRPPPFAASSAEAR